MSISTRAARQRTESSDAIRKAKAVLPRGWMLMDNNRVSGVIDWEGSYSGDCAFDLATMLFYTWRFRDFREALGSALLERTTKGAVAVYLAHMIVRQLDWSMRHHPKAAVDHYMGTARRILHALDQGVTLGNKPWA